MLLNSTLSSGGVGYVALCFIMINFTTTLIVKQTYCLCLPFKNQLYPEGVASASAINSEPQANLRSSILDSLHCNYHSIIYLAQHNLTHNHRHPAIIQENTGPTVMLLQFNFITSESAASSSSEVGLSLSSNHSNNLLTSFQQNQNIYISSMNLRKKTNSQTSYYND